MAQPRPPKLINPSAPLDTEMVENETPEQIADQTSTRTSTPVSTMVADETAEQTVFDQINAYRKTQQLPPLQLNPVLAKLARGHTQEMAAHKVPLGHDGYEDRFKQARSEISDVSRLGENVALHGMDSRGELPIITETVQHWISSPVHHRNIVGDYNLTGIGVYKDDQGTLYFTQMFGHSGF